MKHTFTEKIWNIPNIITLSRLLLLPVFIILFIKGYSTIATIVLAYCMVTDFFDGYFARKLKISSKFGANLDAYADSILNVSIIVVGIFYYGEAVRSNIPYLLAFVILYVAGKLLHLIVHKRIYFIHLYSGKIANSLFHFFVLSTFIFGYENIFSKTLMHILFGVSFFLLIEEPMVVLMHKTGRIDLDTKSIFCMKRKK
ncbi:MAG: CDP-alcohol phosphatidyltransferase family protein [Nanoarchaeota archaeon]|nr:CDP-alcohol phosphatidyltransferase family protein [Nanoarchaeota archaeon]